MGKKKKTRIKTRKFVDQETGEELEASTIVQENYDKDWGFDKVWIGHIMTMIEEIGNQKMKVIGWMIKSRDRRNNMLHVTQEMIAEGANVSRTTVNHTIQALLDADILSKERNGAYQLNPAFIFYGRRQKRVNILYQYNDKTVKQEKSQESPVDQPEAKNGTPTPKTV